VQGVIEVVPSWRQSDNDNGAALVLTTKRILEEVRQR
jgi:hypothetical protein